MKESLYTTDNPVFAGYAFYSALLMIKMILMSFLTAYTRQRKKVFVNAEDAAMANTELKGVQDDDVERIRRAHLNDLENIPIFLITGLIFVACDPNVIFALMLFRIFFVARILHTIVYAVYVVRQPARATCFFTGVIVIMTMIVTIFIYFPQM